MKVEEMERSSLVAYPAKVEPEASLSELIKQVLQRVQKDVTLSKKQAAFCDDACVIRFLKARENNARRAARMLRATLNWREKITIGYLIADEFPGELAAGAAYVAGHDVEGRPVLVIKKKPDYFLNHNHKQYLRFIIFTMEVAVGAMPAGVDQWVLILDVGGYSKISAPSTSGILTILKIVADFYPGRLAKAFIVDASSIFYYVWKGICTFVDHSTRSKMSFAYSRNYRSIPKPPCKSKTSLLSSSFSKHSWRRTSSFSLEYTKSPIPIRSNAVSADYSAIFGTCPKRSEDDKGLDRLTGGPELGSSMRTTFSFSSVTGSMICLSPDHADQAFSSFRKDAEDHGDLEIPGSAPARTSRKKAPSWDGFVSIFQPTKRDDTVVHKDLRSKDIDLFRPYFTFLHAPYDEGCLQGNYEAPSWWTGYNCLQRFKTSDQLYNLTIFFLPLIFDSSPSRCCFNVSLWFTSRAAFSL